MIDETRINLMIALLQDLKPFTDLLDVVGGRLRPCIDWESVYRELPEAIRDAVEADAANVE